MAIPTAAWLDQERIEQAEAAYCEWATWGAEDAVSGERPCSTNDAYLSGYVQAIKALPLNKDGKIVRNICSTASHFSFDEF
ncbi:MAG: hypothetical protein AAFQ89_08195 [Cyanobacteria bacterium J06626_18]